MENGDLKIICGNTKIDAIYDMVTELNKYGFAGVKKDGKWGIIDSNANLILEPSYKLELQEPEFIGKYVKLNFGYELVYYTSQINND